MCFLGDFNAKFINCSTVVRDKLFCNFNHVCNLFPVKCLPSCSGAKCSCVSYDNRYETLNDVVCVPLEVHDIVTKCKFVDDHCLNISRHKPVYVQFVVERVSLQNQCYDDDSNIKLACIKCSMVTHSQIECFSADVESVCVLGGIAERKLSNNDIDGTYHMLTKTLNDCAQKHCPKKRFANFLKPYWNEELSNYHKVMTSKRSMWIDAGRPKCGSVYHSYKDAPRYHTTQYMLTIDHELDSMA